MQRHYWETQDRDRDTRLAQHAWETACGFLWDPAYAMVIPDEFKLSSITGMSYAHGIACSRCTAAYATRRAPVELFKSGIHFERE